MLRRLPAGLVAVAILLTMALVPGAIADEAPKPVLNGAFELAGTNGYRLFGFFGSDGKSGNVILFVGKRGATATYTAHGEGTQDGVAIDLGRLGRFDVEARPTGSEETIHEGCDGKGKTIKVPGSELVGTIEFHGEEGFTEAEKSRTPLLIEPLLNIVCPGPATETESGDSLHGVLLAAKAPGGPSMTLVQNHLGAPVSYEAKIREKEGRVRVSRSVEGRLGAGALRYAPSLASASFTSARPFTGRATYAERTPPRRARPGRGVWRGSLKVSFPGRSDVAVAGPGFKASIVHARRTVSDD